MTVAATIGAAIGRPVVACEPISGGDICRAWRARLDDDRVVFAKTRDDAPPTFFAAEADGLTWLAEARAAPIPAVVGVTDQVLALEWVPPGAPSRAAAADFGRGLAALHQAGAASFGAPWPAFLGSLPLDNGSCPTWPEFYAERRLRPLVRMLRDRGLFDADDVALVDAVADRLASISGSPEPPARLHGDLWNGNILWSAGGPAYLVDASAHGGHRETDLAMLALFGAPYFDVIMAAYDESFPLSDGWADRVQLHQLLPLLAHAYLFRGGYVGEALAAARRYR